MFSADALDDPPQGFGGGVDEAFAAVLVEAAARPVGVGGQRVAGGARDGGGGPAGGDLGVLDAAQREFERLVDAERPARGVGDVLGDVVLPADHLVAERLGERAGDGGRYGGDQADPVAGQARGEDGDGEDHAAGQLGDGGVVLHQFAVREDVGAADVEGAVDLCGHGGGADQVGEDVADGDRLHAGVDPARGDHQRQPLGEVAEHLEGGGAGAQHHGGAQHGGGHPGVEEDAADLGARAQVRGEPALGDTFGGEAAQVDDPADAGLAGLAGEDPGRLAIGPLEVGAGAEGVDEVVRHVDAAHRLPYRAGVGDVALDHLGALGPGQIAQFARGTGEGADPVAGVQQGGGQAAADVAGGAGDQGQRAVAVRGGLGGVLVAAHRLAHDLSPTSVTWWSGGVRTAVRDDRAGPWSHRLAPSPLPRVPGTRMRRGRTGCPDARIGWRRGRD
ncbi:hypothetical protein EES44_15635 [Streptomyces sp. ADI96-15]|nr:hypothetical protein EES44_15635 [Streptomyces sp. ADI96-15]